MDPTTQRMLERARARRQKLDEFLGKNKQDALARNPLQESNQSQFVKVTTEVELMLNQPDSIKKVNVSPTKVEVRGVDGNSKENICTENDSEGRNTVRDGDTSPVRTITRTQLKRLGALYSDSQISSPIHRTENKFAVEQEPKSGKSTARVARFAALADNIKQWEDDLSHPTLFSALQSDNKETEDDKNEDTSLSVSSNSTTTESPQSSGDVECVPRKIVWDENLLAQLEDGERSASSHQSSVSPVKPSINSSTFEKGEKSFHTRGVVEKKSSSENIKSESRGFTKFSPKKVSTLERKSPLKGGSPQKLDLSVARGRGFGSPQKECSPKAGSVLHKASIFESQSPTKKVKDPAELTVSERKALFERNKGQALIPKAAFSMAVPAKYLEGSEQTSSKVLPRSSPTKGRPVEKPYHATHTNVPSGKCVKPVENTSPKKESSFEPTVSQTVLAHRSMFEKVLQQEKEKIASLQSERQKDLDMLGNRWNRNKEIASDVDSTSVQENNSRTQKFEVPAAPPLPTPVEGGHSPVRCSPRVTQMIPKASPTKQTSSMMISHQESKTEVLNSSNSPSKLEMEYRELCKVKKIKVSPPKPGCLYPCLSDIEATTTEAESEAPNEFEEDSMSSSSSDNVGDTSFGREILEAAGINKSSIQMDSSDSDLSESAVLDDMDEFLDDALGDNSSSDSDDGPTPPKRTRDVSRSPKKAKGSKPSPTTKPSKSFRYTSGSSPVKSPTKSPTKRVSPERQHIPARIVEGDQELPLMHSVSFYRRQQNLALKTPPVKQIVRQPEISLSYQIELSSAASSSSSRTEEADEVRIRITNLLDEVSKQQSVISQASQALNLCSATVEFSGSAEQVEGERLLLLATHKRQAALHEIQRLKVEGTLKPMSDMKAANSSLEQGSLVVTKIVLPLKREYVSTIAREDTCHHFLCLVKSQEQVLTTKVLAAVPHNLEDKQNLVWNAPLRLVDLYSDFKVTLEVYSLQTQREILPHNIKYHIGNKKESGKSWLTPKKLNKQESRLFMPPVHSPAGPSAVRSPEFRMAGYVVFSLRELQRTNFTLNKVSYSSPLEGSIQVKMSSELSVDVHERGFLTMFEDVSGFGAWHRRWFVLKGSSLAYWKYPDDEKKVPIGQIDLSTCKTESVGLVSRDICARPNTFLLETTRPLEPDDKDSLVLVKCQDRTIIRNLLSADTKEERLVWCNQLNKALTLLRSWGNTVK